jgi:hypothetical protein
MYRFPKIFAMSVLLVSAAASAFSQASPPVPPPPVSGVITGGGVGNGGAIGAIAGPRGMISSRSDGSGSTFTYNFPPGSMVSVVTGAPYSGQNTSSRVQTLADGTHLTQPASTQPMMYRDSMGRTRTERNMFTPPVIAGRQVPPPPPNPIEIEDPVAGYHYVLDPVNRVAHRVAVQTRSVRPMNAANAAAMAASPGMGAALSAPRTMPNGQIMTTEMIGTQTLFGLTAMGTRSTITYPVGTFQGNDRPLSMVTEMWMAPQYPVLLSKSTGPNGDNTTTMANFSVTEPDPALFQIPEGYQIVDETGQFSITIPRPAQ